MSWKIPLAVPALDEREVEAVVAVLRRKWLTMGEETARFEQRFAERLGCKFAFAVNSCTAALHMANLALGVTSGDEVIVPDLTFVATANAVRYTGGQPVFAATVSERDLNLDPSHVEKLVTGRTKAICVVHYAGFACDMDAIAAVAQRHGLMIIEDCAHAPFGQHRDQGGRIRMLGTIGRIGCFSFFGNKNMTTGEGGMVVTDEPELADRLRLLRAHGMSSSTLDRDRGKVMGYDVLALGYNFRFNDVMAAIGLCQLDKIDDLHRQRRVLYAAYRRGLATVPGVGLAFPEHDLELATPHITSVAVSGDSLAVRLRMHELGIQTSKHYEPVSSFTSYRGASPSPAAHVASRLVTLPLGPHMTEDSVAEVVSALRGSVSGAGG